MLNKVIIFAAGALTGALGGIIGTRTILTKRFNKDLNEVREYYKNKKPVDIPEKPAEEEKKEEKKDPPIFQKASIDLDRYKKYISSKYPDEAPADHEVDKDPEPVNVPTCIPPMEYYAGQESGEYECRELIFYEDDEVLADTNDEVVATGPQIDDLIGEGNIDRYGEFEVDMLYIRMPKTGNGMGTQYSISCVHGTYESVTGIPLSE